jgi:hypothetical protein
MSQAVAVVAPAQTKPGPAATVSQETKDWWWQSHQPLEQVEQAVHASLLKIPEVDLDREPGANKTSAGDARVSARERITRQVAKVLELNKANPDAFIRKLKAERSDLAGLPFILDNQCKLERKAAQTLQCSALTLRLLLEQSLGKRLHTASIFAKLNEGEALQFFRQPEAIAGLQQILQVENVSLRKAMVEHLSTVDSTTPRLVKVALFDLDLGIRYAALEALRERPKAEIAAVLREGFRYPWPPVAVSAARAAVMLGMNGMLPNLVDLLDEPDPGAPFAEAGQTKIRELVRINHHRNCLLCHAPADPSQLGGVRFEGKRFVDFPVAAIPIPGEPFPEPSQTYSIRDRDKNVIRADVTYLRQDFSVLLPVANVDRWPKMQRYDFLVRVRTLKDHEKRSRSAHAPASTHRAAILFALRELTGLDGGNSSLVWRALLANHAEKGATR